MKKAVVSLTLIFTLLFPSLAMAKPVKNEGTIIYKGEYSIVLDTHGDVWEFGLDDIYKVNDKIVFFYNDELPQDEQYPMGIMSLEFYNHLVSFNK